MPNEWDTFVQQHITPQVVALSNKMKELNAKNKFRHKLGPEGYKAAMPKWAKKEQKLCDDGIPDPLEGCTVHTRNWIRGRSRTRIQVTAGERPTQGSPRERGASWSHMSNLFNCIVEGMVCG
jgi:hypothetical protein